MEDQISFGLRQITTEQFAIIASAYDEKNTNVQFETALRFGFNPEQRMVNTLIAIYFKQNNVPFLLLEIGCRFEIIEEHWAKVYNNVTKELKLPKALARHLVMLAIGTLRGVLHAKTENTPFNKFLVHTFNVNDMVKEDVFIT